MKKEDVKLGTKVVPFQKTGGRSWKVWIASLEGTIFKENSYMYVVKIYSDFVVLNNSTDFTYGDCFSYEDIKPYVGVNMTWNDVQKNYPVHASYFRKHKGLWKEFVQEFEERDKYFQLKCPDLKYTFDNPYQSGDPLEKASIFNSFWWNFTKNDFEYWEIHNESIFKLLKENK